MISATGVVHVQPDHPSEVMHLSEWMRESTLFNVLTRIQFFKHYLVQKAFTQWRKNVRFKMYVPLAHATHDCIALKARDGPRFPRERYAYS